MHHSTQSLPSCSDHRQRYANCRYLPVGDDILVCNTIYSDDYLWIRLLDCSGLHLAYSGVGCAVASGGLCPRNHDLHPDVRCWVLVRVLCRYFCWRAGAHRTLVKRLTLSRSHLQHKSISFFLDFVLIH